MKKLSNIVLFPIILGATCLVCGGALATTNYLLHDSIANNADRKFINALNSFFKGNKGVEKIEPAEGETVDSMINAIYKVKTSEDKEAFGYKVTTKSGYSGPMVLALGINDGALVGLRYISGTEDKLGVGAVNKLADYINGGNAYFDGDDFSQLTISAGASAAVSFPKVKEVLAVAFADAASRTTDTPNPDDVTFKTTVTPLLETYDEQKLHVKVESSSDYGNLEADLTLDSRKQANSQRLIKDVNLTAYAEDGEGSGFGLGVLDGTADIDFVKTYVKKSGADLKFTPFAGSLSALIKKSPALFEAPNLAPITSKAYYTMMNAAVKYLVDPTYKLLDVTKVDDTHLTVGYISRTTYESIKMSVVVDISARSIKELTFDEYAAVEYDGKNYGMDIINRNPSTGNAKMDQFISKYVVIPQTGLSFDLFKTAPDGNNDFIATGATHTALGYYTALNALVAKIENGGAN